MTRHVAVSPLADDDVLKIVDYFSFEIESDDLAARFVAALHDAYDGLLQHPRMGSPRWQWLLPELTGVRSWTVPGFPSYLIFYRPRDWGIEVVRVLHGARDIERILRSDT